MCVPLPNIWNFTCSLCDTGCLEDRSFGYRYYHYRMFPTFFKMQWHEWGFPKKKTVHAVDFLLLTLSVLYIKSRKKLINDVLVSGLLHLLHLECHYTGNYTYTSDLNQTQLQNTNHAWPRSLYNNVIVVLAMKWVITTQSFHKRLSKINLKLLWYFIMWYTIIMYYTIVVISSLWSSVL